MNAKRILYVIPYEFYFMGTNAVVGGHTAHIVGVVEALIDKNYLVEIISDMKVPGFDSTRVCYHLPCFHKIRRYLHDKNIEDKNTKLKIISDHTSFKDLLQSISQLVIIFFRLLKKVLFCTGLFIKTWQRSRKPGAAFLYYRHNQNGFIPSIIGRFTGLPCVVEVNTPASLAAYNHRQMANCKQAVHVGWRERIQYQSAKVISVVSPLVRDWIIKNVGFQYTNKILINPNGVSLNRFSPSRDSSIIRNRYMIKSDEILVGMVAVFMQYNAIDQLMESFKLAKQACPRMRLILIGESELLNTMDLNAHEDRLSKEIVNTGRVPFNDLPDYLVACDILVSHFNYKDIIPHGCSIKHLEYMASGRPVVATRVAFVNFAIRHGVNGVLVAQGDIEGFARALTDLSTNHDMRYRLGNQARRDAETYHSWQLNVERILNGLSDRGAIVRAGSKKDPQ